MTQINGVLEQIPTTLQSLSSQQQSFSSQQQSLSEQLHAFGDQQLHLSASMEVINHRVSTMERNNSPGGQISNPGDTSHVISCRPQLSLHSSRSPSLRRAKENPFSESLLRDTVFPRRSQRVMERRTRFEGSFPINQPVALVMRPNALTQFFSLSCMVTWEDRTPGSTWQLDLILARSRLL